MAAIKRPGSGFLILLAVSGLIALGVWIGRAVPAGPQQKGIAWAFASFLFGAIVGLSEILSRYRDEPLLAAGHLSGSMYVCLNGVISLMAFAVLRTYSQQIFPTLKDDFFLTALVSGFGAMAVFRSKFFTFRSADGKDYPIGPAIVLDTILKTIDSKIDRRRATERQEQVFESMNKCHDFENVANYFLASLSSFQNLSQEDKAQVRDVVDDYRALKDWPDTLKCLGLGFAFLNISGEENYDLVMVNLRKFLDTQKPVSAAQESPVPPQDS
jgi:hypothetical protein